ncbi:hypothetical protein SGLAM104S_01859 [Streptomyces glaucescens]
MRHPPLLLTGISLVAFGCVICLAGAFSGLRRGTGIRAAVERRDDTVTTGTLAALSGLLCTLGALVLLLLNRGLSAPGVAGLADGVRSGDADRPVRPVLRSALQAFRLRGAGSGPV